MSLLYDFAIDSRTRLVASALALACLWPAVAGAQADDPTITVCNDCSSGFQYGDAAAQAAQFEWYSSFIPESDDVYVVNIEANQTLAYMVTRTQIDPDPFVIGDETMELNAVPIDGDPALMLDLADALQGIKDFHDAVIQDIPAEELDLPFDSALDLVGGGGGDFNRVVLQHGMEDHFNGIFSQFSVHFNDFVRMAGGIFGASPSFPFGDVIVRVTFPDGTTLRASVMIAKDPTDSGFDLEFDPDVDMESIRGPEGESIPLEPAHLSAFDLTTANTDFHQAIAELLGRLGAELVFIGGGSSGGSCTTTCTHDGNVTTCTLTNC